MPVLLRTLADTRTLKPQPWTDEAELQRVLAEHPTLLMRDEEPPLACVASEVTLPSGAGRLDLLLIDALGRPTAVEVKLRRNGTSRREVFAQVFDYVSALAELRVTQLDGETGGRIEAALRSLADTDARFDSLWTACDAALRNGSPRVVIAMDSAPDDLVRIVRFANDHSDLDIRLVEIAKFTAGDETIVVPSLIVRGNEAALHPKLALRDTLDAFTLPADTQLHGRAGHFRQIRVSGWPAALHYEFLCTATTTNPEIHVEARDLMRLEPTIAGLADRVRAALPGVKVEWSTPWQKHGGRLMLTRAEGFSPTESAAAMVRLIELTRPEIDTALGTAAAD